MWTYPHPTQAHPIWSCKGLWSTSCEPSGISVGLLVAAPTGENKKLEGRAQDLIKVWTGRRLRRTAYDLIISPYKISFHWERNLASGFGDWNTCQFRRQLICPKGWKSQSQAQERVQNQGHPLRSTITVPPPRLPNHEQSSGLLHPASTRPHPQWLRPSPFPNFKTPRKADHPPVFRKYTFYLPVWRFPDLSLIRP